jgi:hypothetical protein
VHVGDSYEGGKLYKRCKLQTQKPFNTPSCSKARFMPVRVRTVTPASGRNRLSMAGCSPAKVLWAVKELFVARHQHLTSVPRRRSGLAPVPWETQREESGWVTNAQLM